MSYTGSRIEIIVDKKGNSTTKVIGVPGEGCRVASAPYEALFGAVASSEATNEAYESPEEVEIKTETKGE